MKEGCFKAFLFSGLLELNYKRMKDRFKLQSKYSCIHIRRYHIGTWNVGTSKLSGNATKAGQSGIVTVRIHMGFQLTCSNGGLLPECTQMISALLPWIQDWMPSEQWFWYCQLPGERSSDLFYCFLVYQISRRQSYPRCPSGEEIHDMSWLVSPK